MTDQEMKILDLEHEIINLESQLEDAWEIDADPSVLQIATTLFSAYIVACGGIDPPIEILIPRAYDSAEKLVKHHADKKNTDK